MHTGIVSIQLNSFNYFYLTLIILFNINHLFSHSQMFPSIAIPIFQFRDTVEGFQVLLFNTNNSI